MGAISNKMTMGKKSILLNIFRMWNWKKDTQCDFFVVLFLFWKGQKTLCHHSNKLLSIWPFVTCPKKEAWDPIKCCVHPLFVVGPYGGFKLGVLQLHSGTWHNRTWEAHLLLQPISMGWVPFATQFFFFSTFRTSKISKWLLETYEKPWSTIID
jgi:hypothetical protein